MRQRYNGGRGAPSSAVSEENASRLIAAVASYFVAPFSSSSFAIFTAPLCVAKFKGV